MQGTNNVINFKWEKFKHSVREILMRIKKFFIYIFGQKKKPAVNSNGKSSFGSNIKRKKLKKSRY